MSTVYAPIVVVGSQYGSFPGIGPDPEFGVAAASAFHAMKFKHFAGKRSIRRVLRDCAADAQEEQRQRSNEEGIESGEGAIAGSAEHPQENRNQGESVAGVSQQIDVGLHARAWLGFSRWKSTGPPIEKC